MKRRALIIIAVLVAVTATAAAYYKSSLTRDTPEYITASVTRGTIIDAVEATGTLEAVKTVQVGTQVSGTIKALYADYNSVVKKGQVVAELEPSLFQSQVDQAKATVARLDAETNRAQVDVQDTTQKLTRAQQLWDEQLIARTDLETAQTAAKQAQAALVSAQAQAQQARAALNQSQVNLANSIIKAPIDGVVISRAVDVGQTVAASLSSPTLFVIANDLSRMQVNARIDESDIGRIRTGQSVTFKVDAYPGEIFKGTVSQVRLEPVTEQNVVSYTTIIDVPNPEMKLKPGMTATVTVQVARADNVLMVPSSALRYRPGHDGNRVWVDTVNGPQPVTVQAGLTNGAQTAIADGSLAEGATVITGEAQPSAGANDGSNGSPFLPQRRGGGGRQNAQQGNGARGGGR
jgi:HlyD family secretion protein